MSLPSSSVKEVGNFCWLCGRTANARPSNWHGPFWLQIAHIASGQGRAKRVDDRRAVTLLCSQCHSVHVSNSDKLSSMTLCGQTLPTIDERHTLWLKKYFDEQYYDDGFLRKIWIGIPPVPEKPPQYWLREMSNNQGLVM